MIPRLHVVTDDAVLADPRFRAVAADLCRTLGGDVALHLRGHGTPAGRLHAVVAELEAVARTTGAGLLVADRVDVALAVPGVGIRVGALSIPLPVARRLCPGRLVGASVHSVEDAARAAAGGADFLIVGTVWATASHPGRAGAGPGLIAAAAAAVDVPVVAIGGVTPGRAREALEAGAAGVAVLRGVWAVKDPVAAAKEYVAVMDGVTRAGAGPDPGGGAAPERARSG